MRFLFSTLLSELALNYLKFRNKFLPQMHCTNMGSPVSFVVANLVMEHIKSRGD